MTTYELRGITWDHSRALPPLVATAQRFEELNPTVRIRWDKRTLHEFGHASLVDLADAYDLLIVDHPMMGDAHASGCLLDFVPLLSPSALESLRTDALGPCFESYRYEDRLYALPVDAAAPAASYRPDLLDKARVSLPRSWDDVVALARRGLVTMPGFPADLFLNFMGLYVSLGGDRSGPDSLVEHESALAALGLLQDLASYLPENTFERNPVAVYELMARDNVVAYCPFAYTYSNYSRQGFAEHLLAFAAPPMISGVPVRTVLGGTGIAISSGCKHPDLALEYCLYTSGRECQQTLYGVCGGQPASKSAWDNHVLNSLTYDFFKNTRSSIENAHVRPRFAGYAPFQEKAGLPITRCLRGQSQPSETIQAIERLYRHARKDLR